MQMSFIVWLLQHGRHEITLHRLIIVVLIVVVNAWDFRSDGWKIGGWVVRGKVGLLIV